MHSSYSIAPSGWQFAYMSFLLSWKLSVDVLRKEMGDIATQRVVCLHHLNSAPILVPFLLSITMFLTSEHPSGQVLGYFQQW